MNKYKICVYAICKNESKFVDRWMDSMSEADEIIVTDTGSTDDTVEKLKNHGAIVFEETINPWRFDAARNISLSHLPDDTDIAVCADLDEVLEPGWRQAIENSWHPDANVGEYIFNWSLKEGNIPEEMIFSKVHKKNDYIWIYPIHECLNYVGKDPEKKVFIDSMVLHHYPDPTKNRNSYLPLLEKFVEEEPQNARMQYYLGQQYIFLERFQDCIDTLQNYLILPSAQYKEQRSDAMRLIAKSYYELSNKEESFQWFYKAIDEAPKLREPYVDLAIVAYQDERWQVVINATAKALNITEKSKTSLNSSYAWDSTPEDLASIAYYQLGMYDNAFEHAKKALSIEPENERLQSNVELIKQKLS